MSVYLFVLFCLSTFYLDFAFTRTSGMFGIFSKLRQRWPDVKLFSCIYCAAPYAALFCLLLYLSGIPLILECIAACGFTALAFRYTGGAHTD